MANELQNYFETATSIDKLDSILESAVASGVVGAANDPYPLLKIDQSSGQMLFGAENVVLTHGSMWAMNPLPRSPSDFPPPCKAGSSPPVRAPMAVGQYGTNPGPCAGNWPTTVIVMDTVRVPADIEPGEYVLGWRWDCEMTAQVWGACSDITIVAADGA